MRSNISFALDIVMALGAIVATAAIALMLAGLATAGTLLLALWFIGLVP